MGGEERERCNEDRSPDSSCELDSCQCIREAEMELLPTHDPDACLCDYSGAWNGDCQP